MASVAWGCASLTVTTDRLLPLLAASLTLLAPLPAQAQPVSTIGRLTTFSQHCRYTLNDGQRRPCGLVELMRKGPTVLRVSFMGSAPEQHTNGQLTFVVITPAERMPLRCLNGRCQLSGAAWSDQVSSAAQADIDGLGLARGVPQAWPVRGNCSLQATNLRCEAQLPNGSWLRAEASL